MGRKSGNRRFSTGWLGTLGMGSLMLLAGACGSEPASTPVLSPVAVETPESSPGSMTAVTPTPEVSPQPSPTATPVSESATPIPTSSVEEPLTLQVLTPLDSIGVEVGALRVTGRTSGNEIGINGIPVEVLQDGSFQRDLTLRDRVNLIEVVASGTGGETTSQQLVVFYVSPTAGLPFTLLYPPDGFTASQPEVDILGVTTLDAIVGVNQVPLEVNSLGIFSASVDLEEGANLVEVVATDIQGNIRFQTVAVFYLP